MITFDFYDLLCLIFCHNFLTQIFCSSKEIFQSSKEICQSSKDLNFLEIAWQRQQIIFQAYLDSNFGFQSFDFHNLKCISPESHPSDIWSHLEQPKSLYLSPEVSFTFSLTQSCNLKDKIKAEHLTQNPTILKMVVWKITTIFLMESFHILLPLYKDKLRVEGICRIFQILMLF